VVKLGIKKYAAESDEQFLSIISHLTVKQVAIIMQKSQKLLTEQIRLHQSDHDHSLVQALTKHQILLYQVLPAQQIQQLKQMGLTI